MQKWFTVCQDDQITDALIKLHCNLTVYYTGVKEDNNKEKHNPLSTLCSAMKRHMAYTDGGLSFRGN